MHPRGRNGGSASKISLMLPMPASRRCRSNPDSSARAPQASLQTTGGQDYLTIEYTTLTNLPDVTVRPVVSSDLTVWQGPATANLVLLSSTVNPNGTTTWRYRDTAPYSTTQRHYIRLEIQPIP